MDPKMAAAFETLLELREACVRLHGEPRMAAISAFNAALDVYCVFTEDDQEAVYEDVQAALQARHEAAL